MLHKLAVGDRLVRVAQLAQCKEKHHVGGAEVHSLGFAEVERPDFLLIDTSLPLENIHKIVDDEGDYGKYDDAGAYLAGEALLLFAIMLE